MTRAGDGTAKKRSKPARLRLGKQGRLVLPAEVRERLGVREGDGFDLIERKGELVLRHAPRRSRDEILASIRAAWIRGGGATGSVDAFIRERREEAAREG